MEFTPDSLGGEIRYCFNFLKTDLSDQFYKRIEQEDRVKKEEKYEEG